MSESEEKEILKKMATNFKVKERENSLDMIKTMEEIIENVKKRIDIDNFDEMHKNKNIESICFQTLFDKGRSIGTIGIDVDQSIYVALTDIFIDMSQEKQKLFELVSAHLNKKTFRHRGELYIRTVDIESHYSYMTDDVAKEVMREVEAVKQFAYETNDQRPKEYHVKPTTPSNSVIH